MQKIILLVGIILICHIAYCQNTFTIVVKDKQSLQPLSGASITFSGLAIGVVSNKDGMANLLKIPDGRQTFTISHAGYHSATGSLTLPLKDTTPILVVLEAEAHEMEEVVIQSTRTSRSIANTPTRVEVIDGEELDEKNNMRPANVSMLLHESTGIQVQQTSATSANASIRVQGLDGRYSQLLKDGYANFGNFANGLSILEIPPLDLKQVEVIKGPASTLYGGGAIAGVINFISKMPREDFQGDFIMNQSNIAQSNVGGFIAKRNKNFGYSLLGQVNFQKAFDVDKDHFSELPKGNNFTVSPKLFFYPNELLTISIGNSLTKGNNLGGDMQVINNNADATHTYFEKNETLRNTTTLELDQRFANKSNVKLKQSLSIFNRSINIPGYNFSGNNINSFSDLSYIFYQPQHTIIAGANLVCDRFRQNVSGLYNAQTTTVGAYFQDTWELSGRVTMENGLRVDNARYQNNNFTRAELFFLPRVSLLLKINNKLTSRISAGMGYKTPTIFTEQTEALQYRGILPLQIVKAERSIGGTADVNYKTAIGEELSVSINQMFFFTRINHPLVLEVKESGSAFYNAEQPVITKGFETNLKLIYKNYLKLFTGYTFTNAKARYLQSLQHLPLTPHSRFNCVLMYEKEDNFKFGLEGYFTDTQQLSNGAATPSYWEFGFLAQKTFGKFSLFINFENFSDQRQSRYKPVANPPHNNPLFDEIWNHTEGRVVNGGIKIKL